MSRTVPDSPPGLAALAAERRYSAATLARWQQLPARDAEALRALATELRPSENQLRDLWEWAADVATRDDVPLATVLAHESLVAVRRRPLARSEKLKLVKAALRRLRYPRLAAAELELATRVGALALPRGARVEFPPFLEGDDVHVSFVARSAAEWEAIARALLTAASDPHCHALFDTLAGAAALDAGASGPRDTASDAE